MRRIMKMVFLMALVACIFQLNACTEAASKRDVQNHSKSRDMVVHTATISITGPKERGMILKKTKVVFKKGDTALKVLLQAAKKNHIEVDYSGSGTMGYVNGIDNIYEFDNGPKSGWVGKLNGKNLTKSADAIPVKDGDQLEFSYTQ